MADSSQDVVSRPTGHGQSSVGERRDQDAVRRDENAVRRDEDAVRRDENAGERDVDGERRDMDAESSDEDAAGRDLAGTQRDADAERCDQRERESELRDVVGANTTTGIGVAAALSGPRRGRAASDRRGAARDRAEAAAERGRAGLDRGAASADRAASASDRDSAGSDRGEAAGDRAPAGADRQFTAAATQVGLRELAATVDAGFALRQIDPPQYLYLNPAFFKIFGFDPDGPTPTPADLIPLIHPDDQAGARSALAGAGETVELWRIIRPDGGQRWISGRVSAVTDDDGVIRRVAVIFEDITNRKAVEVALRDSQARFDQFARSTEVGFLLRESTQVLYMNPGMSRIFGANPDLPLSVLDMRSMIHPEDRDAAAAMAAAVDLGSSTRVDLRIISDDGDIRWIRATNDPVTTTDGRPRVASTVTDITELKALEAAVRAAQVAAERANAAKNEFLSRMSHELRTPLNSVLGFAQLLELDALPPSQEQAVGHILRGGRHLLAMINDVLDITGIESDRLELSPEPVHVAELISDTIDLMQPLTATNRTRILFDPGHPAAPRYVRADRRRLRQVLLNLLSNAIKYNHPDGRIEIRVVPTDDTNLRVAVTDTGIGIPAEDLPRLFNPFDRLGRQSSDIEGTGLGLALSKRLTTAMGGRLDVESTPGHGSTFTVTMPITDPPQTPHPPRRDLTGDVPATGAALSTVLYIEDNPFNVDLLTGILRRRPGWSMVHAGNGVLGLELAATGEPAVILLDLHLPDIDGIDVLKALRTDPKTSHIPVAVISADATRTQVRRLFAAGAQKYLVKPINVRELLAFLDTHALAR